MSSQIEELLPLVLGKGVHMRAFIDHSKPEDSLDRNWTDITADGKPDSDILTIPNHWHREQDEVMTVLEGKMIFNLDGKQLTVSAGDEPLFIRRGQVHGFTTIKGVPVRFLERAQPAGTYKAHFFQDLFQGAGLPGFLMSMRVFYDGDTYLALPGGFKALDYVFLTVVGFVAKAFVPAKPAEVKRKSE